MLSLLRLLMLLLLVLLLRIILSPLDISLAGIEGLSISLLAPLLGLILLFVLEVRQDSNVDFGPGEYVEGLIVLCFGAIPYSLSLYAIMITGMVAGWVSHTTGGHW
ncbi:MAG: hypothetical protein LUQ16_05290 [Methanomassiliicoccales archaeon]|nr:hypothetical protein [Methanomassiliicoccales archaeon]